MGQLAGGPDWLYHSLYSDVIIIHLTEFLAADTTSAQIIMIRLPPATDPVLADMSRKLAAVLGVYRWQILQSWRETVISHQSRMSESQHFRVSPLSVGPTIKGASSVWPLDDTGLTFSVSAANEGVLLDDYVLNLIYCLM